MSRLQNERLTRRVHKGHWPVPPQAQTRGMVKRAATALLWLFAVAWGFNLISAVSGIPPTIGPAIALAIAALVGVDPLHLIWPVTERPPTGADRREAAKGRVRSQI